MSYFEKVKKGDKVFGLVFGKGIVTNAWGDGHYTFEVQYVNGSTVPYTEDGYPGWSTSKLDFQTVYYKNDIDLMKEDFTPSEKILSVKKIIKYRDNGKLEVKCPSGIWQPYGKCPSDVSELYLEENKLSYFRKAK